MKYFTNDTNFLIDFSAVASKETDLEMPVTADENDPHVYYIFRYPMTCGELCFTGAGCGACEEEPAE